VGSVFNLGSFGEGFPWDVCRAKIHKLIITNSLIVCFSRPGGGISRTNAAGCTSRRTAVNFTHI